MKTQIQQRLDELIEESLVENAPAVHFVAHLLLNCYLNGTQNELARWCCEYSAGGNCCAGTYPVAGGRQVVVEDIWPVPVGMKEWEC